MGARLIDHRLAALMVVAFVDTLGAFLVFALLPFYAERYGATPTGIGVLMSAFAFASMATAPLWGRLADRSGRRPAVLLGLVVSVLGYLAFALAESFEVLLASRLVQGVGGGTVPVVFAYISDVVPGERRAEALGWVSSVTSAAAMIGPALGSLVSRMHPAGPGVAVAAFCSMAALFALFWLPESRPRPRPAKTGRAAPTETDYSILRAVARVVVEPGRPLHLLIWIYAAGYIGMAGMTAVIGLYLSHRFGVDESTIWWFFAYLGGLSIVFRLFVLGPAVRRWGEIRVLRRGAFSFGLGLVLIPFASGWWTLAAAVFLIPLGTALLFPSSTSQVSRRVPDDGVVGQVLGVQQAFGNGAKIVAPLLAGYLFETLSPTAPFVVIGAVLLVTIFASLRLE